MASPEFDFSPSNYFGVSNDFLAQLEKPFEFMANRENQFVNSATRFRDMYLQNQQMPEKLSETKLNTLTNNYNIANFGRTSKLADLTADLQIKQAQYDIDMFSAQKALDWQNSVNQMERGKTLLDQNLIEQANAKVNETVPMIAGESTATYYKRKLDAISGMAGLSEANKASMKYQVQNEVGNNINTVAVPAMNNMDNLRQAYQNQVDSLYVQFQASLKAAGSDKDKQNLAFTNAVKAREELRRRFASDAQAQFKTIDPSMIAFARSQGWVDPAFQQRIAGFEDTLNFFKNEMNVGMLDAYNAAISGGPLIPTQETLQTNGLGQVPPELGGPAVTAPAQAAAPVQPALPNQLPTDPNDPLVQMANENGGQAAAAPATPATPEQIQSAEDTLRMRTKNLGDNPETVEMVINPTTISTPEQAMAVDELLRKDSVANRGVIEYLSKNTQTFDTLNDKIERLKPAVGQHFYKYYRASKEDENLPQNPLMGMGFGNSYKQTADFITDPKNADKVTDFSSSYNMLSQLWPGAEALVASEATGGVPMVDANYNLVQGVTPENVKEAVGKIYGAGIENRIVREGAERFLANDEQSKLFSEIAQSRRRRADELEKSPQANTPEAQAAIRDYRESANDMDLLYKSLVNAVYYIAARGNQ